MILAVIPQSNRIIYAMVNEWRVFQFLTCRNVSIQAASLCFSLCSLICALICRRVFSILNGVACFLFFLIYDNCGWHNFGGLCFADYG